MKPRRKYFLLAGLSLFLFVSGGIAFASSSQYLTQAQKFINDNCSNKKIDNQTALLCYVFNKSQEQDVSIASLNTTLSPMPSEINSLNNHQTQTDQSIANLQQGQSSIASQYNDLS